MSSRLIWAALMWISTNTLWPSVKKPNIIHLQGFLECTCPPPPSFQSSQRLHHLKWLLATIYLHLLKSVTYDEKAWDLVRNYATSWPVIKRVVRTEDDEEEEREQTRTNAMPQAEQNTVGWFNERRKSLATKLQEVFICPERRILAQSRTAPVDVVL